MHMSFLLLTLATLLAGGASSALAVYSLYSPSSTVTPYHRPLSQDYGFSKSFDYRGKNTFGWKYRNYMVGQGKQNRRWWQRSLEKLQEDGSSSEAFRNVNGSWWFEGDEALNRVCRKAYVKLSSEVEGKEEEKDIWKYCSLLGSKPVTLSEGGDAVNQGTIGKELESKVISTVSLENELFWSIRNQEFFLELGKWGVEDNQLITGEVTIRDKCEEAYKSQKSNSKMTTNEVMKYCGFEEFLSRE